jgi:hypothetical protein
MKIKYIITELREIYLSSKRNSNLLNLNRKKIESKSKNCCPDIKIKSIKYKFKDNDKSLR